MCRGPIRCFQVSNSVPDLLHTLPPGPTNLNGTLEVVQRATLAELAVTKGAIIGGDVTPAFGNSSTALVVQGKSELTGDVNIGGLATLSSGVKAAGAVIVLGELSFTSFHSRPTFFPSIVNPVLIVSSYSFSC